MTIVSRNEVSAALRSQRTDATHALPGFSTSSRTSEAGRRVAVAPLERILVATDFTPGATAALHRVLALPIADRGLIELVHVLPADLPRKSRMTIRAEATARLDAAVAAARIAATRAHVAAAIHARLEVGPIPDAIIGHAQAMRADLVVVGRHGRRIVRDLFIGSTARRVAHRSPVPVLIVNRTEVVRPYARPLVAIDPDAYPDMLLDLAARVLADRALVVRLVHAFHVLFESLLGRSMSVPQIRTARVAVRGEAMERMRQIIAGRGTTHLRWKPVVRRGDPRALVLDEAARRRADLVVVGTRGRSAIARALIGGVSELVIDAASCDVLVVPPVRADDTRERAKGASR